MDKFSNTLDQNIPQISTAHSWYPIPFNYGVRVQYLPWRMPLCPIEPQRLFGLSYVSPTPTFVVLEVGKIQKFLWLINGSIMTAWTVYWVSQLWVFFFFSSDPRSSVALAFYEVLIWHLFPIGFQDMMTNELVNWRTDGWTWPQTKPGNGQRHKGDWDDFFDFNTFMLSVQVKAIQDGEKSHDLKFWPVIRRKDP